MNRFNDVRAWLAACRGWRRLAVLVAAGAMAGLSMPPVGAWPLLFVAFPVFLFVMEGAVSRWRTAFMAGWAFGLGYFAVSLHWIGFAFLVNAATYLWMMPFMVGGLAAGMAIYWGIAGLMLRFMWCEGISRALLAAAAFGLLEWLRGHLLTGFPWAAPGLAAVEMGGLMQLASVTGMTGLTFLIVLWASLPAARPWRTPALVLIALLPAAWLWGEWRLAHAEVHEVPGVMLRIVQPSIPQSDKWRAENGEAIFDKLMALSQQGSGQPGGATHVIWPESAVPFLLDESEGALAMIDAMLPDNGVLITGSLRRNRDAQGITHVYNSILGFDGSANLAMRYDKWRLVPGGEFLPFESLLEPLGFRRVVTVPGSFTAGSGPVTLPVPGAPPAGFLICYEAIFPHDLVAAERPGWLVNVTNDGWFGHSAGPYQHLAQVQMRAAEQGIPIARAANTGISAVIDPYGRIVHSLALGQVGVIDSALPESLAPTPYSRAGDRVLALMLLIGFAVAGMRKIRYR